MITLNGSLESVTATLSGAVSTDYASSALLTTSPGTGSPAVKQGTISSTTETAVVSAPSDGVFAQVTSLYLRNAGVASVTVTVKKKVSSTGYALTPAVLLQPGEALQYTPADGFTVLNATGRRKTDAVSAGYAPAIRQFVAGRTAGLTATKTLTNTTAFAYYIGKANQSVNGVTVRARVTQALAAITAGEVALAKGAPGAFGATTSLTVVGYADVAAIYNATGIKDAAITLSAGQTVDPGDDLWVVFYGNATTPAILRAYDAADDIQSNVQLAATTTRPSAIVGTPTAFTVEGATVLAPWFAVSGL